MSYHKNSKLKFIVVEENHKKRINAFLEFNGKQGSIQKIVLEDSLNSLLEYAQDYSFQNNIYFVIRKKNFKHSSRQTITFDQGKLILTHFNRYEKKKKKKHYRKLAGFSVLTLSGLVIGKIVDNNYTYSDNNKSLVIDDSNFSFLNDQSDLVAGAVEEINNHSKKLPNITIDSSDDQVNTSDFVEPSEKGEIQTFSFSYEDRSDNEEVNNAKRHMEVFNKFGTMYGIDPKLLMAIMCQESSGIHKTSSQNGYAIGGMQIESFWHNKSLSAYNFELGQEEELIVDPSSLSEFYYNVKIASMILQNFLKDQDYDIAKSVQQYNYGLTNMRKLGDNWSENRGLISAGDSEYYEHVFSFLPSETVLEFKKEDGSIVSFKVSNQAVNDQQVTFKR